MEEYIAPNRKRIPYGMMNYAVIRRDDCYYVDKTLLYPSASFWQELDGEYAATLL